LAIVCVIPSLPRLPGSVKIIALLIDGGDIF